ncbi:MAG: hypothetical protein QG583_716 [Patescibacteria group bacterium]|nr:hypothetical protein [Patescibacteria group bacterium]
MEDTQKPVITNYADFDLKKIGFKSVTGAELKNLIPKSNLFELIEVLDNEIFFVHRAKRHRVIVRTTFIPELNDFIPKGKGAGKIYVVKNWDQQVAYATKRFYRRARRFWNDLGNYAHITKRKVDNVPKCPCTLCNTRMSIVFKSTNQVYWECRRSDLHPDGRYTTKHWDTGMPPKFVDFLNKNRKRNRSYLKKLSNLFKKDGKVIVRKSRIS